MKSNKWAILIFLGLVAAFTFSCCDQQFDLSEITKQNLAAFVQGTYTGQITNSSTDESRPATLTVTSQNDSLISMHFVASKFDSTIMVSLYQNSDSIMVCSTGNDFYSQYGHEMNMNNMDFSHNMQEGWSHGNMNCNCWAGNDQSNAWTNHLNTQHDSEDEHFGGFDTKTNLVNYEFQMKIGSTTYFLLFQGIKNK